MITHEKVLSTYEYSPDTGVFRYRVSAGCRKAGDVVGWIDESGGVKYLITKVDRQKVRLHRLAYFYMTGHWPNVIDHINGDGTDNRWLNIRNVNHEQNCKNTKLIKSNKTGIHGVFWYKGKTWMAYISSGRKKIHLGYSDSFFEACCMRKSAELEFGFHKNHGATWR